MLERESVYKIELDTEPRSKKGTMVHRALRQTPCRFTCSSVWSSLSSHMRVSSPRRQILETQQKGCISMTYGVIAHTEEHHIIRFLSDDEFVMYDLFMPGLTDVNVRKYKDKDLGRADQAHRKRKREQNNRNITY